MSDMREEHRVQHQEYVYVKDTTHLAGQLLDFALMTNDYIASKKMFIIINSLYKLLVTISLTIHPYLILAWIHINI